MTYIKKEDVLIEISKLPVDNSTPEWAIQKACLIERLNSLPSIDFDSLLEKEINKCYWSLNFHWAKVLEDFRMQLPK